MIRKRGSKFTVTNKTGTKVLGTHPTKKAAARQLAAIEISKAKHMSENKNFKAFRNELSESEYKETLTGHPNRGIDTDVGGVKHDSDTLQKINGVLAALGRYTYQHTAEAMIKIRTRLNLFMIDFPWTPWMWQSNPTGTFTLNATLFGRVDGVDALTGGIRVDGKANPNAGMKEFALVVTVEPAEDGFYRVNAKLQPQIAVVPESVENIGDSVEEDFKIGEGTDWKSLKKTKANLAAIRASGKRVITQHGEGDTIYKVLPAKHSVKPVKEEMEQITEAGAAKLARMGYAYDRARIGSRGVNNPERKQQMRDAYYKQREKVEANKAKRVAAGTFDKGRELQAHHKRLDVIAAKRSAGKAGKNQVRVDEAAEQIDELSKATRDAYISKRGSQLSSMMRGPEKYYASITGRQQKNAVKGIKMAMRVKSKSNIDETLIGGQKRLDVNKNKRLDSQDFKLLRANKKKPMQEAKMKIWTPRLDKLMKNRDAVRSKPKKTILTQKVQDGKKMGSPRPIPAFSEETKPEQKKPWWMTSTAAELAAAAQSASNARRGEEAEKRKRHAQQNRRMKWTLARKQAPGQIPEEFDSPSRFTIDEGAGPPPSKSQLKKSIAWLQSLLKDPKKLAKSGMDVEDVKDNINAALDMLDFANQKYRS